MATKRTMAWAVATVLVVAGCHQAGDSAAGMPHAEMAAAPIAMSAADAGRGGLVGQQNPEGSFLAYVHQATVRTDAAQIGTRVDAVRAACMDQRFGQCTVLNESQQAGEWPSGSLQLRAEPKAIGPLVDIAADGAELSARSTLAEDLADAVRDNGLRRTRLEKQHARLLEFLGRSDLDADALVALTGQLAQIESELQFAEQEAAQQQRRIRTNLLTLNFQSSGVTVESSDLRQAFRNGLDVLDTSTAVLVTLLFGLAPFAVVGFVAFLVIRGLVRRRRRRREALLAKPAG